MSSCEWESLFRDRRDGRAKLQARLGALVMMIVLAEVGDCSVEVFCP